MNFQKSSEFKIEAKMNFYQSQPVSKKKLKTHNLSYEKPIVLPSSIQFFTIIKK